ncbi:MAG TPA: NAD(P)H-hydrate dehydratase [Thermomicrobiales bacterium]|nr:NAD(P)H-hydrate dehydratase [Thermomicrobiales bacterium]
MTAIVSVEEMRAAEVAAVASGIAESELMLRAAGQIAGWIDRHVSRSRQRRAVALVGPGNNGDDALVALALLHERGWSCASVFFGRTAAGLLPASSELLSAIEVGGLDTLGTADVVIDGVYGIGGRPSVPKQVAHAFDAALAERRARGTPLVAIDVPSGIDATTGEACEGAFQADVTLCLGFVKRGLVREPAATFAGDIELLSLGLPAPETSTAEQLITTADVRRALPRRQASAHKYDSGTALIIAGASMYYGAPRLAAEAALRAGAGLVALATPSNLVPVIAGQVPEAVFVALSDDAEDAAFAVQSFIESRSSTLRSIVIGPGIGRGPVANAMMNVIYQAGALRSVWAAASPPGVVIDADALNWLSANPGWHANLLPRSVILTPHAGEMSRLTGLARAEIIASPHDLARQFAVEWQQHVVLKAGVTSVATPDGGVWVAPRATPELATAGTGDVLAGLIGGLLAQGLSHLNACTCGLWIGAMAGRASRRKQAAVSVVARDVIEHIGRVVNSATGATWNE